MADTQEEVLPGSPRSGSAVQPFGGLIFGLRWAVQVSLDLITPFLQQECLLPGVFNTLGDYPQSQAATHGDYRTRNCVIAIVFGDVPDERAVNLQLRDR